MYYILLLLWLTMLIKWADLFVDGASWIAKKLWLSPLLIGLTIVAMGTSAPELFVNINAALGSHTDLAMGNIIGSNISNIMLIGWIWALCGWMLLDKITLRNFVISLAFVLLLGLVSLVPINDVRSVSYMGWILCLLARWWYMYYMIRTREKQDIDEVDIHKHATWVLGVFMVLWLLWLFYGSDMVITNALLIGSKLWISERIMGLVVVAIGTSLPELVTTVVAVRKWQCSLWIGNIIGSNIFNIWLIGWLTAIIHPITFSPGAYVDLLVLLSATLLFICLAYLQPRYKITRLQWCLLIVCYILYVTYSILS